MKFVIIDGEICARMLAGGEMINIPTGFKLVSGGKKKKAEDKPVETKFEVTAEEKDATKEADEKNIAELSKLTGLPPTVCSSYYHKLTKNAVETYANKYRILLESIQALVESGVPVVVDKHTSVYACILDLLKRDSK